MAIDSVTELQNIASTIRTCTLCTLCEGRTNAVPGSGNLKAEIVFIGEGPGKNEDVHGVPFCGASGKLLDQMLLSIGLARDDVFITNIVKCRPPGNRDPLPFEKVVCATTYLDHQLDLINPKLIVTLGRHALNHFIPDLKISEVHGHAQFHNNQHFLPLYHPAVALYNGGMKTTLAEDFLTIPTLLQNLTQTH